MPNLLVSDPEIRQRRGVFNLYMAVAMAYAVSFTPIFLFYYHYMWLGWLHLAYIPLLAWLIWDLRHFGNLQRSEHVLRGMCSVMVTALALSGGASGTGLHFSEAGVVFIFFLGKRKWGILWALSAYSILMATLILSILNLIQLPYSHLFYAGYIIAYGLTLLFLSVYVGQKDKLDRVVSQQVLQLHQLLGESQYLQHELAIQKMGMEESVKMRTHQLSEAKAELIASVSGLPIGFALVGSRGEIVFSNAALAKLLHREIPLDPVSSRRAFQQIAQDFHPGIDILECVHQVQTKHPFIERNIEQHGHFYRFFFTPVVEDSETIGAVMLMEDTTEQRNLERSRDEFFSIASHELRTPLTAVRGNAGMMLQYYGKQLKDPALHEMVEDIHDASIRLISIVNDFLDVSRLEQGRLVFKHNAFDITKLVQTVLRQYEVTSSRRKLKLELIRSDQPIPLIYADADRIRQILINLISNGIKYTEHGGITLHLTADDHQVKISVTDTGKGIPEDSRHLLFHKFQQASNNILTRDNTRSTGLGLYISHLMAEEMGGRLYLDHTQLGHGSTFALELPLAKESQLPGPESKPAIKKPEPKIKSTMAKSTPAKPASKTPSKPASPKPTVKKTKVKVTIHK